MRAWELDVGEWEGASGTALADAVKYTVMMNMAPIFLRNSLQLGTYSNSAALRAALLQWCFSSRNFGANSTVTAGNVTSEDDDRMQVDSSKKGEEKVKSKSHYQKGNRPTSTTNTSSHRYQPVQELWQTWTLGERLLETQWRSTREFHQSQQPAERQGISERIGKGKHGDVVESNQPSDTASTAVEQDSNMTEDDW